MSENNPYTTPESNVYQPDPAAGQLNLDWNIGDVLSEAWEKTNGYKLTYMIAVIIYAVISYALSFVLGLIGGDAGFMAVVAQIIIMLVTYPLTVGLMMIGIKRIREEPVQYSMVFDYYPKTIPIFLTYLLMTILIAVGMVLLVLPGIYLAIAYALAGPLLVDKNLGIWGALEASRKTITQCWFRFFGLMIVLVIIIVVSAIPLGIGLIWTLPMASLVMGIIYRNLIGSAQ